ncbi:hypothetical protein C5167_047038 [Papaver somniferum]|uniref:FACT complex subunit n=1 Tax=Papaver somniferum TaxID=3469 RepID=A0A4Y7LHR0_PAPSO|nr:FACT complex subunit SPT16-like [Papaver somniferum]RZC84252.1 hypothetical protein C5167_047038 [Papaver somniferum]
MDHMHCYHNHFLHLLLRRFKAVDLSDNPELIKEEKRRYDQAQLACRLKIIDKQRLLGVQSSKAISSYKKTGKGFMFKERKSAPLELKMEEEHAVIRLTAVTVLPKVGSQVGETFVGTLEAHVNGFLYKTSSFHMHYFFDDIKKSFFRLGDNRMPPLLHFHLHKPIMMGSGKTTDIEFHLAQCPLGQMRSDHDSDKIEKEKQIRDGGLNEDLKNFVGKVNALWKYPCNPPFPFEEIKKEYEFYGVLSSKPSAFALTIFNLIVFVETPFVMVPLRKIEIVNLALLRPQEIDMTVIFREFKEDGVLEINSIPLRSLDCIKRRLNLSRVKYYVNAKKLDWKAIVEGIADFPKKFIDDGGWDYFKLEDRDTLAYYMEPTDCPEKFMKNGGRDYFKGEHSDISAYCRKIAFAPE